VGGATGAREGAAPTRTAGTAVVSESVVEPTGTGLDPAIGRTGAVGSCAACLPTEITTFFWDSGRDSCGALAQR
jgi:hypothetical protein